MIKLLIDTNIVLDVVLKREPFYRDSKSLFNIIDRKFVFAFITATTITDIYYIARKELGRIGTLALIKKMFDLLEILSVDKQVIFDALDSDIVDFEDAIQVSASKLNDMDAIITRDKNDFANSEIRAYSPVEYLSKNKKIN